MKNKNYIYLGFKRALDVIMSIGILGIGWPLFIVIGIAIKIEDPKGPIFFSQKRIGRYKKPFLILKFRSMYSNTPDIPTHLLVNPGQYITKIGKVLRRTSLDEIPQIINVLRGEMTLIGPRPALWNQEDLIALRDQEKANDIRPGITGLAQVNGRDELALEEKVKWDGIYTRQMNFKVDMVIFFRTIKNILFAKGIIEGRKEEKPTEQDYTG